MSYQDDAKKREEQRRREQQRQTNDQAQQQANLNNLAIYSPATGRDSCNDTGGSDSGSCGGGE